jgi:uncharacterized membrane protein YhaH (DUF805 family)
MKYLFVYGLLSGLVLAAIFLAIVQFAEGTMFASIWFGYLVMLVALIFVFVGVKRYRDIECGGVVRFVPALAMGLAIAIVGALVYHLFWEAYLAATHYAVIDRFFPAGAGPEVDAARAQYGNPLFRIQMTFMEIGPAGLLVALVSAGLLRDPRVFPARGKA